MIINFLAFIAKWDMHTHNNNNNTIMMNAKGKDPPKKGPSFIHSSLTLFMIVDDDVIYRLNGNNCTLEPAKKN